MNRQLSGYALVLPFLLALSTACDPEEKTESAPSDSDSLQSDEDQSDGGNTDGASDSSDVNPSQNEENTSSDNADNDDASSSDSLESDSGEESGVSFSSSPEDPETLNCDIWTQDCPDGEKCVPFDDTGGNTWSALRCVPIVDSPSKIGERCVANEGGTAGIDNCEAGSMCYYVDPSTREGTCTAFCTGNIDQPQCDDEHVCSISNSGVLVLCRKACDPLAASSDCPENAACLPATGTDEFVCIIDASGRPSDEDNDPGSFSDSCDCLNCCNPGLYCIASEEFPDCEAEGCCTRWCVVPEAEVSENPCADPEHPEFQCLPFFEEGQQDPNDNGAQLGYCRLPETDGRN